jgi:hypothetical protein
VERERERESLVREERERSERVGERGIFYGNLV